MRVQFRGLKSAGFSTHEGRYVSSPQIFLTQDRAYEVHAVSVYDGVTFALVVDDKDTPIFLPRGLFEVVDTAIPEDWICNLLSEGSVQCIIGPTFIAENLSSYNAMIDQNRHAVESFWRRVESMHDDE